MIAHQSLKNEETFLNPGNGRPIKKDGNIEPVSKMPQNRMRPTSVDDKPSNSVSFIANSLTSTIFVEKFQLLKLSDKNEKIDKIHSISGRDKNSEQICADWSLFRIKKYQKAFRYINAS